MNESFSVGRGLSLGLSITFRNFIPFAVLAVLVFVPQLLYVHFSTADWGKTEMPFEDVAGLLWWVGKFFAISFLCSALLISTYAYGVVMELRGQHAGIGATLSQGLRRFFPVLGTATIIGVLLMVVGFGVIYLGARMNLGTFGQVLVYCTIGAIWSIYLCAIPAAVIEPSGLVGPLSRSSSLTQGRRGAIFGMLTVYFGAKFIAGEIVTSTILTPDSLMGEESIWDLMRTAFYVSTIIDIVFSMFLAVAASVTYYLLRAEKEGTSADELASVFE